MNNFKLKTDMTFEEASDMYAMYSISPELTCQCDDHHLCQQCHEEMLNEKLLNGFETTLGIGE
jgi:hypothetical protein